MPEGVEVKLSAEVIKPLVLNQYITDVEVASNSRYSSKRPEGMKEFLEFVKSGNCQVKNVKTHGKFMYWEFTNGWYMFCTFGMSGQWSKQRGKHPCLIMKHSSQQQQGLSEEIVFNDPRHFGTIKFANGAKELNKKLTSLGWDPLQSAAVDNLRFISAKLSQSSKPIAEVLMDQNIFSGVGNYIRAEALYLSKLSPWRISKQLPKNEILNLCESVVQVMKESYQHQGATIHTYKTVYGEEGKYSSCFKVYGQAKDPLGNNIITEQTADKRTIHWCPSIQV